MAKQPQLAASAFRDRQELSAVSMAPTLLKQQSVSVSGTTLTVKNGDLAKLIQSKLSAASKLGGTAASDADVSIGIKVHF